MLKSQVRAAEQMAIANMRKAAVMEDQAVMSLFRPPIGDDLDEEVHEYFKFRRKKEMERIKRRMESERRTAEREEIDHDRFVASQVRSKCSQSQADPATVDEPPHSQVPNSETLIPDVAPPDQPLLPINSTPPVNSRPDNSPPFILVFCTTFLSLCPCLHYKETTFL